MTDCGHSRENVSLSLKMAVILELNGGVCSHFFLFSFKNKLGKFYQAGLPLTPSADDLKSSPKLREKYLFLMF